MPQCSESEVEVQEDGSWRERWLHVQLSGSDNVSMYLCQSCGHLTETPRRESCRGLFPGSTVPCDLWPMTSEEWLKAKDRSSEDSCIFTGTVMFEDGTTIKVCIPLSNDDAKRFAIIDTELKLRKKKKEETPTISPHVLAQLEKLRTDTELKLTEAMKSTITKHYEPLGGIVGQSIPVQPYVGSPYPIERTSGIVEITSSQMEESLWEKACSVVLGISPKAK